MTQSKFDYKPYIIVESDSRVQRLTKIRDFLIALKDYQPLKFNYSSFLESTTFDKRTPEIIRSDFYFGHVNPNIKEPLYHNNVVQDSVRESAFDDEFDCGTCACVAGWVCILDGTSNPKIPGTMLEDIAFKVLKLSDEEENDFLFYGHPNFGHRAANIYGSDENNIDEAVDRINVLIERSMTE